MLSSKFSMLRIISYLALGLIFHNEFAVYWINYMNWPSLHLSPNNSTRILLVADPQLIGENDEPWYYSWIARWDSDRYLKSTFLLANSYVKPDATVFLGDLFDEGLKSTEEQYERYFKRFQYIFQCEKMLNIHKIKQIFVSGDNDIGGEYYGDRNDYLGERFENHFSDLVDVLELNKFLNVVKLDVDYTVSFYNSIKRNYVRHELRKLETEQESDSSDKFTIILNHMSLIMKRREELDALNDDTNAGLIIKGDSHKFYIAKYNYLTNKIEETLTYDSNPINFYILNLQKNSKPIQTVYELSIPTCSYRMGESNMGYGMLTITPKGKVFISILWLPQRFFYIKLYLIFLFCLSAFLTFRIFVRKVIGRLLKLKYIKLNDNYYDLNKNYKN